MGDAEAWRRWNAWRYVLHALEEIAPEALEDLARLVPVYQEAAPHMDRRPGWYYGIIDWESLEEALRIITDVPGFEESLAKLKDFREALLAWGRKWNLAHPEPLGWAMENLRVWAKVPEVARKPVVYTGPLVNIPPFPPFRPLEFSPPIYGSKKLGSWSEVEKELRQAFESWLRECRALYEEWALHKRDLLKHARWWVAHRVKRWPIRNLHQRARKEGLVKDGRVLIEEGKPSTISEAINSLDQELNYPAQELSPPAPQG
jgi:hypothetical protein